MIPIRVNAMFAGLGLGVMIVLFDNMLEGACAPPVTGWRIAIGLCACLWFSALCIFHIFRSKGEDPNV